MAGLNRTQIENEVARQTGVSHKEAKAAVAVVVDSIQSTLIAEERVHITGLGSFNAQQVPSRMVRNPATGKQVRAEKTARVVFRPSNHLKELIADHQELDSLE